MIQNCILKSFDYHPLTVENKYFLLFKKREKKNSLSWLFFLVFTFLTTQFNFGQDATQYTATTSTGISLNSMAGSTQIVALGQDDTASAVTNIGFTFGYCGTNYTQFSASSNGVMRLGGVAVTSSGSNSLTTNSIPLIAPFWDDMHTGSNGKVHYLLSGSAPNRILTIEWLYRYWLSGTNYTSTVQAVLVETTNIIHFIYGTGVASNSATVGINSSTTLYQSINTSANTVSTGNTTNNTVFPTSGRRFTWSPPVPTITSLGSASGCPGSNITINGTNLTGATSVTIGGTEVSSITSNSATQIVAVIGSGTTGTVAVTTSLGIGTSGATFTVNPAPVITSQPVTPAAVCDGNGSRTVSVTATGASSYQWRKNGGNLTEVAPYSNVNSATLTITNPAAFENGAVLDVVIDNGTCTTTSTSATLTVNSVLAASVTPSPANAATGVCYSGTGAITNVSWAATATATSYDVYFGAGSLPGSTTSNVATNSYTCGTLLASTTYYWKVVAKNACGDATGSSTWTFTTSAIPCGYCTPTGNLNCTLSDHISNITFNTLNNTTTCGAGGYTVYAATGTQTTSLFKGSTYTFSLSSGSGSGTHGAAVWIDFNQNGVFTDTGEYFLISNSIASSSTVNTSILIPAGATSGATKMRIRYAYNVTVTSTMSCTMSGTYGETEDYTITLVTPSACVTPTAQPTALILTPTSTTIVGSFTVASPAPTNYLVVINTTGTTPTPVNGTTYTVGEAITGGTVVDIDTNTSFNATGLAGDTLYYIFVFSYNGITCSGGPLYNTTIPLTGNTTTLLPTYCVPTTATVAGLYINSVSFVGTLNDTSNTSTYTTGYQNFTGLASKAKQAQGEGININASSGGTRGKWITWVDWNKDGDFTDSGETVYDPGAYGGADVTFGYIVPASANPGLYTMRIRVRNSNSILGEDFGSFTPCENFTGNYIGEAEDYRFEVVASCSAAIASVTNGETCGIGTVALSVTGSGSPTEFRWYSALTGGSLVATTATGDWTTPVLSTTTTYYVTAYNGCESLVRTSIIATISPTPTLNFTPSSPTVCGENSIVTLTASGDEETVYLINENFEAGTLGVFSNINNDTNTGGKAATYWMNKTSTLIPAGIVWFPAISSGFGTNKFVLANSDPSSASGGPPNAPVENSLTLTSSVSSASFTNLTLKFDLYYSRYSPDGTTLNGGIYIDDVTVQVSTNGGGAWTTLSQLIADIGIGTRFQSVTYDLTAYINQANLKIRVRHRSWAGAGWLPGGVAVDNVQLYGERPLGSTFTWTSPTPVAAFIDLACTIPYSAPSAVTTVYIQPTFAQLSNGDFTFTATTTLSNGCAASQPITVTNNSKIWQTGGTTDWNTASNWLPNGVPNATSCVIIPNNSIISGSGYDAYAKNLTVKSTGLLELQSNNNLTVTDWVNIDASGVFNVKNNASLIQINNTTNTIAGTFNMERITQPMTELDYTYWGSPLTLASGFTLGNLSPNSSHLYEWIPSVSNGSGNWSFTPLSTVMTPAKGYIVRAPDNSSPGTYTANFIGAPNNGDITIPITYGTLGASTNDNWNLISNPYPSAINAATFLNLASNLPVVGGTVYFWTHNSPPSSSSPDPFYGDFAINYTANDYASWNLTGGVGTEATSGGGVIPNGHIAAGSGFFIKSLEVAGNATFTNAMRVSNYNNQFFKNANPTTDATASEDDIERHRIWLNLTNNSGAFSQILVGYIKGATNEMDRSFDGQRFGGNGVTFYSILPEATLGIQGRMLPFDENDQVPLGFNAKNSSSYSIRIDHLDGLFDIQKIFLQDKLLNLIHDLRIAPYVFTTEAGNFNDRFVLLYKDSALGTDDFDLNNSVKVIVNEKVTVHSSNQPIKDIIVFDLLGRKIDSYKNIDASQFTLNHLNKTTNVLILKITLANDITINQKITY